MKKLLLITGLSFSPLLNAFTIDYESYNQVILKNGLAKTLDNNFFEVGTKFRPVDSQQICVLSRVWVASGFKDESLIFFRAKCPEGNVEGLLKSMF